MHSLSVDEVLLEPYNYLIANPGKDIRGKLIDAFDHWLQVPKDKLSTITTVVEMLHTAKDDSVLRRGVPAELINLHRGQGMELHWRDTLTCPSEAEFIEMHTTSIDLKQYAINIMNDTGSFEYTRNYLAKTENSVHEKIKTLGGNPLLENIIDLLSIKDNL
ncbi:8482_t:CDS:2 [Racocetra fulgida]|uniref:8482_t:CDS:1 n=1 Tax=Racocetra fulgida TaxID=60492 RepID=A0A9N8Z7K2_9GLOM|nr:8482_t:CDS:2 [Racocetra fulgida]